MARETSIEAYNTIKENGVLSKRRWEVYDTIFHYGPMTGRECFNKIGIGFTTHTAARLTELREMGAIKEVGKVICSITGMRVIQWDVTSRVPERLKKLKKEKCQVCGGKGWVNIPEQQGFNLKCT